MTKVNDIIKELNDCVDELDKIIENARSTENTSGLDSFTTQPMQLAIQQLENIVEHGCPWQEDKGRKAHRTKEEIQ